MFSNRIYIAHSDLACCVTENIKLLFIYINYVHVCMSVGWYVPLNADALETRKGVRSIESPEPNSYSL